MARYFFDIYDGSTSHIDTNGIDFGDLAAVRGEVRRLLPEMALADAATDDDRHSCVVVVRDAQRTVYSATLTYTGQWHLA